MGDRAMTRRRVLAVTSQVPWPLDSGGHLRTFHLLRALAQSFDVRLVAPASRAHEDGIAALRGAGIEPAIVPVARRGRVRESMHAAAAAIQARPYVLFGRHLRRQVAQRLRTESQRQRPDVLYLDHLDSLLYADCAATGRIVMDMHNVYSSLAHRTAAEYPLLRRRYLAGQARLLEREERAAARTAHALMAVSRDDAQYFSRLGARHVVVVPNGVDCERFAAAEEATRASHTILYVGALDWPPNVSAARFLAATVLPAVKRRIPDARLVLVGRNPTAEVVQLAAADGAIQVAGNAPDVVPFFRDAGALAVPLEAGGGSRLKILEAFAAGVPVVSTPIGCEGIDGLGEEHLTVCERTAFADAIVAVMQAPGPAHERAARARALARQQYDWAVVGRRVAEAVAEAAQS